VPVLNAGDGAGEHPSQALLDIYTIQREFSFLGKRIDGSCIALLGDLRYGRTVHSLARLLSLYNDLTFTLYAPHPLEMPEHIVELVRAKGHTVEICATPADAMAGADAVYATRIQLERMGESAGAEFTDYRIDQDMIDAHLPADALLMHPLPRDSREGAADLSSEIVSDPRLAIFRQADNGVAVRMAIFTEALSVSHLVARSATPVPWFVPATYGSDDATLLPDH
jgi:aspartate carbamoyltransferase catalytic subunit